MRFAETAIGHLAHRERETMVPSLIPNMTPVDRDEPLPSQLNNVIALPVVLLMVPRSDALPEAAAAMHNLGVFEVHQLFKQLL